MKQYILGLVILTIAFRLDYSLEDVNTTSNTYQQFVGPSRMTWYICTVV